jgi:4-methyl-5(b-hydroxyethyl)-thiazole monophosphate biosynthesis
MAKRVLLIAADGLEDIEAVASIDVLNRSGVSVTLAALRDGPLAAAYGSRLLPDTTVDRAEPLYDAIVLPGGRKNAEALAANAKVVELVRRHNIEGRLVAAICAAPSHVLAEAAGVLGGRKATGDPAFNDRLAAAGAYVTNQLVTVDRNIITGMGPGAALAFALMLAEYLVGREIADSLARKWHFQR